MGRSEGSGAITASGLLTWTAWSAARQRAFQRQWRGSLLNGGSFVSLGRTLNNPAGQTITMSGTGGISFESGGVLNNAGTFLAQNDSAFGNFGGGPI